MLSTSRSGRGHRVRGRGRAPRHRPRRGPESRAPEATRSRVPSCSPLAAPPPRRPAAPLGPLRKPAEPIGTRGRPARPGIGSCGPGRAPPLARGARGILRRDGRGRAGGRGGAGRGGARGGGIGRSGAPPLPLLRPDLPAAGSHAEPTLTGPRDSARRAPSRDIMVAYWRQAGLR